jgi:diadenosine tetraphosphate (Ap4A) HIT family hydrolase
VDIVKAPGRFKDVIVYQDEDVLIVKDKFPKARVHLLCLPTEVEFQLSFSFFLFFLIQT